MIIGLKDAAHEAACMKLDLADAVEAKTLPDLDAHLGEAIRRHALLAVQLRYALTEVRRRQQVLSMQYPANLGGGFGPDRSPA